MGTKHYALALKSLRLVRTHTSTYHYQDRAILAGEQSFWLVEHFEELVVARRVF